MVEEKDKVHCDCRPWDRDLADDLAWLYWFILDHRFFLFFPFVVLIFVDLNLQV